MRYTALISAKFITRDSKVLGQAGCKVPVLPDSHLGAGKRGGVADMHPSRLMYTAITVCV